MGILNSELDRERKKNALLVDRIVELQAELHLLRTGYQGACYACEPVGEENVRLQSRISRAIEALQGAKSLYARREVLRILEGKE